MYLGIDIRKLTNYNGSMRFRCSYGNVIMERDRCPECGGWSFIRDGRTVCCGANIEQGAHRRPKRMSDGNPRRCQPPQKEQLRILRQQDNRCFYCGRSFWASVWRNGKRIILSLHWDHFIPFSFARSNSTQLFVAGCRICNGIKHNLIFETPEEAREYVNRGWKKKGYTDEEMRPLQKGHTPSPSQ